MKKAIQEAMREQTTTLSQNLKQYTKDAIDDALKAATTKSDR